MGQASNSSTTCPAITFNLDLVLAISTSNSGLTAITSDGIADIDTGIRTPTRRFLIQTITITAPVAGITTRVLTSITAPRADTTISAHTSITVPRSRITAFHHSFTFRIDRALQAL